MSNICKCKLTKISRPNIEGGLRTNSIEGNASLPPTLNVPFVMVANPLSKTEELAVRYVQTSKVTSIVEVKKKSKSVKEWNITTESGSKYNIEGKYGNSKRKTRKRKT